MIGVATPVGAVGWEVIDRFEIGLSISPHGLGIMLGYLAGAYVFLLREAPRRGYTEDAASSMAFWALVGAVVGSRLGYVITHLGEFDAPLDVLRVWEGGLSQLGGVVGAVVAGSFVVRRHRVPYLPALDAAAIPVPLGVVIGRIGDLIIGDHLGKPTSWALAWKYEGGRLPAYDCTLDEVCRTALAGGHTQVITRTGAELLRGSEVVARGIGVHQTALYDLAIAMLLVLFLVFLNRRARRTGVLFLTYVAWYGAGRILTDFLRVENRFFGLTGSQWTSIIAVTVALATLAWFALRPKQAGTAAGDRDVEATEEHAAE